MQDNIGLGRLRRQELENSKRILADPQGQALSQAAAASSSSSPSALESESSKAETAAAFSLSLSSLPSSFTTLLMSVLDSPAYSNLTSAYLNTVFNPSTPDDPRVKYFSVAGRTESLSLWHPLWLPKMVLDGYEEKDRENMKKKWEEHGREELGFGATDNNARRKPLWDRSDQWGNDGLVTIQSSKWGEFLGTLEGCDHWEMRGARGIELNMELPLSPLGIGSLSSASGEKSDGWGLKDWAKFVGAWKKQEQREKLQDERREEVRTGARTSQNRTEHERKIEREQDDAIIKSSTDKLSAVFDWVVDQVPATRLTSKDKAAAEAEAKQEKRKKAAKSDLATKMDLEKFYVALSRKLYDEGL